LVLSKKVFENQTKIQDCDFNNFSEGKNYNPMKHCEHYRKTIEKNKYGKYA